jgi:IS5 family transposase
MMMVKALFLQHFFALSDPQLEEQVNDRLSFRAFLGLGMSGKSPDFTSFWKFKDEIAKAGLTQALFEEVNRQLDGHGLIVRVGTIVDATMVASANRNVSATERPSQQSNPQVDTDARKGAKGPGRYTFGYKAHIGLDAGRGFIRKRVLTGADVHDSRMTEQLCSGDEKALFGDKAYFDGRHKAMARQFGWYYGVLERPARGYPLSAGQRRSNRSVAVIRAQVESRSLG